MNENYENPHILRAIELLGSQSDLARRIGCNRQNVLAWLRSSTIPAQVALKIHEATDGVVSVQDMRPDLPWHVIGKRKK